MSDFITGINELFSNPTYLESLKRGFSLTLIIAFSSALIGLFIGIVVALVAIAKSRPWLIIPKAFCRFYTTVIRGTPMALQLFIMFYIIFAIRGFPEIIIAILAFGINSGAYVSENIRAGFLSVDRGQKEAGLALGLPRSIVMRKIIAPQAFKNCIPSIGNEIVALIKETSIVSMIGMYDLNMAAKDIGSGKNMASYIIPMFVVALFYLAMVYLITFVVRNIERKLRKSDIG